MTNKNKAKDNIDEKSGLLTKKRIAIIKFLIIIIPLLLSMKFYTSGPYPEWVRNYFSCVVFVIFSSLVIMFVFQDLKITRILFFVFFITSALELLQFFYPSFFSTFNTIFFNRMLLGTHASLHKIPYYGVGAFISYYVLKSCDK